MISTFRCSISKIPLLTNVFNDLQVILTVFDYNVLVKVDYGKLVGYALTQEGKKGQDINLLWKFWQLEATYSLLPSYHNWNFHGKRQVLDQTMMVSVHSASFVFLLMLLGIIWQEENQIRNKKLNMFQETKKEMFSSFFPYCFEMNEKINAYTIYCWISISHS